MHYSFKDELRALFPSSSLEDLEKILLLEKKQKSSAKLGDSLVNFIFSISKSLAIRKLTGTKVSDHILAEAYRSSVLGRYLHLKGKKDKIGDQMEALILFAWINGFISLEEIVKILRTQLEQANNLTHPNKEREIGILAFRQLLDSLAETMFGEEEKLGKH
ncbi:MAG: ribonuclease III family protein [Candidatus Hodarchaeota archaeon]